MIRRSPRTFAALVLPLAMFAAACGDSDDDSANSATGSPAGQEADADAQEVAASEALSGDIFVTGSSTVEPITIRVAESFEEVASDVVVDVEGPGTGDGFLKFCQGEAVISDASRAIKEEEAQTCADNGIDYVELQVAIDGIAVITNPANEAVDCLNFTDLYALVGPESEGFASWADAQAVAGQLGSGTTFPDAPLDITAPGTESGTYDSFIEIALADAAEERGQEETTRADYSSAADDNVIVTNIAANPSTFGWVGYAFYEQNQDALKAISIAEEPGGTCVEPTSDTIASGEYPLSRPLFIYVNSDAAQEPAVAAFVEHYLEFGLDEAAADAGYVAHEDDVKAQTRSAWDAR